MSFGNINKIIKIVKGNFNPWEIQKSGIFNRINQLIHE